MEYDCHFSEGGLILIFKKVLRAGCDEDNAVFRVGEELLEETTVGMLVIRA